MYVFNEGLAMEKDGRSSAMSEGEGLDEEDDDGDDDEEGGAETEEQSGNESEMNEQEEDVSCVWFDDLTVQNFYILFLCPPVTWQLISLCK